MSTSRFCSRSSCRRPAVATLTYDYATSTVVVGPLALPVAEPQAYDLCEAHARGLTAPRGWQLVRHDGPLVPPPDDLGALADAVREPGRDLAPAQRDPGRRDPAQRDPGPRGRPHLRLVPPPG